MRRLSSTLARFLAIGFALGCGSRTRADSPSVPGGGAAPRPLAAPSAERRALVLVPGPGTGGPEKWLDAEEARRQGYTIVNLSDSWTPFIFTEAVSPDGTVLGNRYRSVFLGLANDTGDPDGQPLAAPEEPPTGRRRKRAAAPAVPPHNYLELYGIPPTLSVLRSRFLEDAPPPAAANAEAAPARCADVDLEKIRALVEMRASENPKAEAKSRAKLNALARELEKKRRSAHVATLEELQAKFPKNRPLASQIAAVQREPLARVAFPEVERRLQCEQMFVSKEKHTAGLLDEPMRQALLRFQRKHKIYDGAAFRKETMAALGRPLLENDQLALVRVITERAVSAADVLEDGTAVGKGGGAPTYVGADGQTHAVRNLVEEATQATLTQLGLTSPEASLAFFQRHPASDFSSLLVAIKLPPPPEYYSPAMELSVLIDRGDVFYDPPFDENGKHNDQTRHHFPKLDLRVKYRDQLIPLVHWRTTIGGWRSDLASNGYEYYRYKGSDVGPRAWRHIVAGPVWIAPNSTPIRSLVKSKTVRGVNQLVVNYDEVGPGYLSAYGLVAAYNIVPGQNGRPDWDNGVRVHGSSEYRSIFDPDGFSHGCHRLVNHLAVRLFSFVLQHRTVTPEGDQPLGFSRQFLWKDDIYEMRLPTRGYRFVLDPPLPVNVLEGNILGKTKKPITTYMPKPGVQYPPGPPPAAPDSPEGRAGGGE